MKIENVNEWIYYYHIKDEEALPTLIEHFKPMVQSMIKSMYASNEFMKSMQEEYESLANETLVNCLESYRFNSSSPFYMYYYMCLKRNYIDELRYNQHASFPANISTISLDMHIKENSNMYYLDVISDPFTLQEDKFVLSKCQRDHLLTCAKKEMSQMDYSILKLRHEGYSVTDIAQIYGVSKQFVYYRLKKIRNWFTSH